MKVNETTGQKQQSKWNLPQKKKKQSKWNQQILNSGKHVLFFFFFFMKDVLFLLKASKNAI